MARRAKELLQNPDLLRPAAKPDGRVVAPERPQRGLWPRLRAFCASLLALRVLARPRYGHGSAIAPKHHLIAIVLAALLAQVALASEEATPPDPSAPLAIIEAARRAAETLEVAHARSDALRSLAESYAALGAREEASAAMAEAIELALEAPTVRHLLLTAGEASVRAGLYESALAAASKMTYGPDAVRTLCEAAQAQIEAGRREGALEALRRAAEAAAAAVKPGEPAARAWSRIAVLYHRAGLEADFEEALGMVIAEAQNETGPVRQSAAIEHAAEAYLEAGRLEKALGPARGAMVEEVAVGTTCRIAEAYAKAGDPVRAAEVLYSAASIAHSPPQPERRVGMLVMVAASCRAIGRRDMLLEALAEAERICREVADDSLAAAARDKLLSAYAAAGELAAAERVAAAASSPGRMAHQMLAIAVRHVEEGHYAEAVRIVEAVDPRYRRTAGRSRLAQIGIAYRELWGLSVPWHRIMGLQPLAVRDAVLVAYAEAFAERGDFAAALERAEAIAFVVTRDDALLKVARHCLADAGSMEQARPAVQILGLLTSPHDRLRLRTALATKKGELGRTADALAALRELDKDIAELKGANVQAELLHQVAMGLHALGRSEESQQAAARAIAAAMQVGCASCRDNAVEEMFELLSDSAYMELAAAAGHEIGLPHLRAESLLRTLELAGEIEPAQRAALLRELLEAVIQVQETTSRVQLLLRVARAYHEGGLPLTDAELAALQQAGAPPAEEPPALEDPLLRAAHRTAGGIGEPAARVRALIAVARACADMGHQQAAAELRDDAERIARKLADPRRRGELLAAVHDATGPSDSAEQRDAPQKAGLEAEDAARQQDPEARARGLLRMAREERDLPGAERERLLREALAAALETRAAQTRVALLVELARAFDAAGLQVTQAEREALEKSPLSAAAERRPIPELRSGRPGVAQLVYFDRPGCPLCDEVKALLPELERMFPGLALRKMNLSEPEATRLNMAICEALDVPAEQRLVAPSVFSARGGLIGAEISLSSMAELAAAAEGLPSPAVAHGGGQGSDGQIEHLYQGLRLPVVVAAGLLDGINPCAFTVIIFFLAYLAHVGRDRRQIATAGVVFTAAVFVTYLAIGAGLAGVLTAAAAWSARVQKAIYAVTAALALLAAALSLRDGLRAMAGRTTELTLALPEALQSRIRRTISRRTRMGLTVAATAVLGGVVALFEFPCTGQVYAPVIVYVLHHSPGRLWGPLGWLVLYNVCFIAPLVVVFVAVIFGLTSERLTAWFRRHLAATKLAMAALFAALGLFMLSYLL